MQVTKNITLDLLETGSPVIIKAKQNDRNTRYIAAHLYVDGLAYPVPSGTEIAFRYKKPDGTAGFYDALPDNSPAITVSGNTVTVELVEQVLTAAGCVHCEINMYNAASEKLTTFTFEIAVEESVLTDAEIISIDYYNVLTAEIAKALQAVTDATEQAENAAQSAQDAADNAAMSKDWAAGQPVTYNGTPVSIAYAGAQRIAAITAYGETPQGGTTEAPVALTGVDSVHVCGRNLLPLPYSQVSETKNGLNIAVNADGTITVSGTATAETYLNLKPIPASLYRLMGLTGIVPAYDYPVTTNGFTFFDLTIQPDGKFARVYIVITKGSVVNRTYRPYIIKSAEPLPYEPYQGSVTPLPIPRPLRRVGDVRDVCVTRQEYEGTEKLVVTYNVGFVELDGTEGVSLGNIDASADVQQFNIYGVLSSPNNSENAICSHFERANVSGGVDSGFQIYNTLLVFGMPMDILLEYGFITGDSDTYVPAFKAYLAAQNTSGTPVQVAYQLASPETYATDPVDFDNTAGPLTVMTGGELEVRMTELVGNREFTERLSYIGNPNLLDNSNFTNPVNQRDGTSYSASTGNTVYAIDRWRIEGATYTVATHTLSGTSYTNRACRMAQFIEMEQYGLAIGDTLTFSLETNGTKHSATAKILDRDQYSNFESVPSAYSCADFDVVLCTGLSKPSILSFTICPKKALVLEWAKLEKGSVATPYVHKSYGAELSACQRYFYYLDATKWYACYQITGWGLIIPIDLPVPMRAQPTANTVGEVKVFTPSGWVNATSMSTNQFNRDKARINIVLTMPSGSMDSYEGRAMVATGIESLSADL